MLWLLAVTLSIIEMLKSAKMNVLSEKTKKFHSERTSTNHLLLRFIKMLIETRESKKAKRFKAINLRLQKTFTSKYLATTKQREKKNKSYGIQLNVKKGRNSRIRIPNCL